MLLTNFAYFDAVQETSQLSWAGKVHLSIHLTYNLFFPDSGQRFQVALFI
jgi:hypothetical protein